MNFDLNEEQRMYRAAVRQFVDNELAPHAATVDAEEELHWEAIKKMPQLGLTGLQVPEEYGGANLDSISAAIAIEEASRACGSTGLALAAHNGLCCGPLVNWGTDEQKEAYLPTLTSGEVLGSLALTEPNAGSDLVNGVSTSATCEDGEWIINGEKTWITNATSTPIVITLVRTHPEVEKKSRQFSMLIVETDTEGFTVEPPIDKMGVRGSHSCPLTYQDAHVPEGNLLGEAGRGLYQTLTTLDAGRISIAACCVGLAQAALDEALKYIQERETFGVKLYEHQAVQMKLADMASRLEASRTLLYRAAYEKDQGRDYNKIAGMAKLIASEASEYIAYEAIQLHGGYGYSNEFPVERIYRDQRLMTIGEGANDILRMVIARRVLGR